MLPFETLIRIDKTSRVAVYQQIANQLIGLIQGGVLKPGSFLPGSRVLAERLSLHRKTIVAAYDELFTQDWITAIPRKGVMVAANLPSVRPRSFQPAVSPYVQAPGFSFDEVPSLPLTTFYSRDRLVINDGFPDARLAPLDTWLKEGKHLVQQPQAHKWLMYGHPPGQDPLCSAMVRFLSDSRGLNITEDNLIITRGAQMSIYLAAALLLKPGDQVMVASPNYFFADLCFEQLGARLVRVPADRDGIDVDQVEAICRRKKIRLLYVIPHHHHPTTVTLSAERRMKLLELIRRYNIAVIEDDYDYDFHYSAAPMLPLASADHGGNVLYIGSFTKSLGLGIRTGFLIGAAPFIRQAARLRRLMDLRGDHLTEETLAVLLNNGTIERHLKKVNKIYQERRDLFCSLLETQLGDVVNVERPVGGMAVWARFKKRYPLPAIAAKAAKFGLSMGDGIAYNYGCGNLNALRMGFAALNRQELQEVVSILRKCV